MLKRLRRGAPGPEVVSPETDWRPPSDALRIDLLAPTRDAERVVKAALGLQLPPREEMAEIEPSSRLYQAGGATFMTATLLARRDDDAPGRRASHLRSREGSADHHPL